MADVIKGDAASLFKVSELDSKSSFGVSAGFTQDGWDSGP